MLCRGVHRFPSCSQNSKAQKEEKKYRARLDKENQRRKGGFGGKVFGRV